jgi:hypothetical protein
MTSPFKLPSHCKTCFPAPFLKLQSGQDGNQSYALSLRPLCSVLAAHVLYVSLIIVKTRKGNGRQSKEYSVVILQLPFLLSHTLSLSLSLFLSFSPPLSPSFLFFSTRFPAICFPTSFPSLSPQRISLGID